MGKKNKNRLGQTPQKKSNTAPLAKKLPDGYKVYLKKDDKESGQYGILTKFSDKVAEVYFPKNKQTKHYNFYKAFLQSAPLFETKDEVLLKLISEKRENTVCSGCGKRRDNLTVSGKHLLCQDCFNRFLVCEKCHSRTKALYDFYDMRIQPHRFFLVCPDCLRSYIKEESSYFIEAKGLSRWYPPEFRDESLLRQYGYTVDAKEGLTQDERKCILYSIVRNGFLSKGNILKHLQRNIDMLGKQKKMEAAVQKWKEDIAYLKTLNPPYKRPI